MRFKHAGRWKPRTLVRGGSLVFCYHTEEFADSIATAVQDCDTVALEYAGFKSKDERQAWNEMLTTYVSSTATQEQKLEAQAKLAASRGGAYLGGVLEKLQGSDKKIALLDMDEDDPNYSLLTDYWNANRAYYKAVGDGSSVQEIKQNSIVFLQAAVDSFPIREATMAQQLKDLGRVPGKIGVPTGIIHTPVLDEISSVAEASSTVIGPEIKVTDGSRVTEYDDMDLAIQQARANGVENVDDALVNRAVLKDIIDSYDVDLGDQKLIDLLKSLDPERIDQLLQSLDGIREATNTSYHMPFLRIAGAKNAVVESLRAVWPAIPENPKVVFRKL